MLHRLVYRKNIYETQMREGPGLKAILMGVSKAAYELTPMEEIRQSVQEGQSLSGAGKWRLGVTALSKTAALGVILVGGAEAIHGKLTPQTVLSGHGSYNPADGTSTVPKGASVRLYSKLREAITNPLGNAIETGAMNRIGYSRTFGPGRSVPDLTLHPPTGLSIMRNPTTVAVDTPLSQLVEAGGGVYHWAACTADCGAAFTVRDIVSPWKLSIITPADVIAASAFFSSSANNVSKRR